jgi:hypothetical protein
MKYRVSSGTLHVLRIRKLVYCDTTFHVIRFISQIVLSYLTPCDFLSFRSQLSAPTFKALTALSDWLAAGSKPIYIGFGSMVIDDSQKLVDIIKVGETEPQLAPN